LGATKLLAEAEDQIRTFQKKNEAGGKQVLIKTLDYYVEALKFNPGTVMAGLDEEIK
jgi:hypothetical protein